MANQTSKFQVLLNLLKCGTDLYGGVSVPYDPKSGQTYLDITTFGIQGAKSRCVAPFEAR